MSSNWRTLSSILCTACRAYQHLKWFIFVLLWLNFRNCTESLYGAFEMAAFRLVRVNRGFSLGHSNILVLVCENQRKLVQMRSILSRSPHLRSYQIARSIPVESNSIELCLGILGLFGGVCVCVYVCRPRRCVDANNANRVIYGVQRQNTNAIAPLGWMHTRASALTCHRMRDKLCTWSRASSNDIANKCRKT